MKPKIDRHDVAILRALQSDARQSNRAVATAVGLAPSTTLDRIRDLERRGVITGYHAEVDPRRLNRPLQAIVAVRLQPKTSEIVDRFVEQIWAQPETLSVSLVSGADDVLVHLSVPDTGRLRHLVLESIASFPGVVDERTSLVFEHRRKTVLDPLD